MAAERARGGFHAGQRIVLDVLQRVDRVVADHPQDRSGVEQQRRQRQRARHRRPADQRRPGEDDAEPRLRPPGDPLHERIGRDRREAAERDRLRQAIELQQHDEPDEAQGDEPRPRRAQRHAPAGERARPRCAPPSGRGRDRRCRYRRSPPRASRTRRAPSHSSRSQRAAAPPASATAQAPGQ